MTITHSLIIQKQQEAEASVVVYKQIALDSVSQYFAIYETWQKTLIELQVTYAGLQQTRKMNNTLLNGRVQLLEQELAKFLAIREHAKLFPEALNNIQLDASMQLSPYYNESIPFFAGELLVPINIFRRILSETKRVNLDTFDWSGIFNQEPLAPIILNDPAVETAFLIPENKIEQAVVALKGVNAHSLTRHQIHELTVNCLMSVQRGTLVLIDLCRNLQEDIRYLANEKQTVLSKIECLQMEISTLKNECKELAISEMALRILQRLYRRCNLRATVPSLYNFYALRKLILEIKVLRETSQADRQTIERLNVSYTNKFDENDGVYPEKAQDRGTRAILIALQYDFGFYS